ncbi:hypothetical protein [Persicitalea jodogahamensis]|uniref:Lipoprotein n=1 Tax=Persicitalea jodogahamensis TaxID=402147 RepID=A0A8J3GAB8_9BACT|nr:hypothetical protein [Persicitalea jodogahamensis]GHB79724.1 hypothetical protein GCM10007390_37330 [Persicitalea jodogahamensis]
MKKSAKLLAICLPVLFTSCEKPLCNEKPNDETAGIVVRVLPENYLAYRQEVGDLARDGIHLTTEEQYRQVFDHCCAGKLESVDFSKYDVLGASTINQGVGSTYMRDVQVDSLSKKIKYTITERYCRKSSPVDGKGNFVVVPKLPIGYSVEYVRK